MSDKAVGRPMKFPYTFSAKMAQFPWKFYFGKQWVWKYFGLSVIVCLPIFKKIHNLGKKHMQMLINN